jgi:hypothetical protein
MFREGLGVELQVWVSGAPTDPQLRETALKAIHLGIRALASRRSEDVR